MYGLDNIWKGAKNLNIEKIILKCSNEVLSNAYYNQN